MITTLICMLDVNENAQVETIARQCKPFSSNEPWFFYKCETVEKAHKMADVLDSLDLLCLDISRAGAVALAELLRRKFPRMVLIIIANESISPMLYLRPSIMAASLLLRPFNEAQIRTALIELFQYIMLQQEVMTDCFIVESKDEMIRLEYSSILLFEAREKKVFVYSGTQEYGFYNTLDNLVQNLPDYFVRCHRSFVCNFKRVKQLKMNVNLIILDDNSQVPLSRSYRNIVRSRFNESRVDTKRIYT